MQAPLRILHLEDDARDAELLLATLEAAGIVSQVTLVDSQADFSASLERGGWDLVLADYSLPSFDGLSALKIALEKCPDVPFIFVSGTLGEEVAVEALKIGAADYVLKERLSRLALSVQRALREAQARAGRKRAEEALSESEYRYRMLIEKAYDAIFLENERDEIIEVNEQACALLGYSREELLKMKVSDLQAPEFGGQAGRVVRDEIEKHGGATFESMDLHRSGRRIAVEVTNTPIYDRGQKLVLAIRRDITERKRQEEELRQAQAAQFEIRLEARVMERTRIARELHDTLLQNFQGLVLRFQSVLKMLPENPLEARQRLETALHQAAEAITEARDAIQGLRAMVAEGDDLARAVIGFGEELAAHQMDSNSPAIHLDVKGRPRNLNPVVRDEAYRIASEALRNAFRHAQAQRIIVEIHYDEQQFRLRVRDDGKGIDEETLRRRSARHFGLPGMRERAEIVGGHLEVWSKLNSGTQVDLSIPGGIAYDGAAHQSVTSVERPT